MVRMRSPVQTRLLPKFSRKTLTLILCQSFFLNNLQLIRENYECPHANITYFQPLFFGEAISYFLPIKIPASVIGMAIFAFLCLEATLKRST